MRAAIVRGALAIAAVAIAAAPARADVGGWQIVPTVGTDALLDVEAGVVVEAPFRLRISTAVGVMPHPYVEGIVDILDDVHHFKTPVGPLIDQVVSSPLVWRTMVGFRPWRAHGFYAMVGYGLIALGATGTPAQALDAADGQMLPPSDAGAFRELTASSTLHTLDVDLGWRWQLPHRFVIQAGLGGVFTVAASSTIVPDYVPKDPASTAMYTAEAAAYLDHIYTKYVYSPTIVVSLGYRL